MPHDRQHRDSGASSQRPERVEAREPRAVLDGRSAAPVDGRSAMTRLSSVSVRASSARSTRSANSSSVSRPSTVASRRCTIARERSASPARVIAVRVPGMRDGTPSSDAVRLHYVEAGEGPLVVLLHGFPEFWYGWRHQIAPLAAAGLRVVAPDLRGYNLCSKPRGRAAYALDALARDIARADRGARRGSGRASPATTGAARSPGRPRCTTPRSSSGSRSSTRPTRAASRGRAPPAPGAALLVHGSLPAPVAARVPRARRSSRSSDDPRYREAWAQPGALTAMFNYYRAMHAADADRARRRRRRG